MGRIIFYEPIDNDDGGRVIGYHDHPETIPPEELEFTNYVECEEIPPSPDEIEGKIGYTRIDLTTKEMTIVYEDRVPTTSEVLGDFIVTQMFKNLELGQKVDLIGEMLVQILLNQNKEV